MSCDKPKLYENKQEKLSALKVIWSLSTLAMLIITWIVLLLQLLDSDRHTVSIKVHNNAGANIEEKTSGNTGTPADLYNRNPFSVFDTYSPYNIYQNP
ncbi:MAG: hypothetical protein NAG76_22615 [Candidatus Pristimantibacillus lignocellulolyticus]|uniref:Uncharacterized protein n=1 Tax=Candidatus Pristimantibacillus lignocellulolyticus TaxID=2994561 RepID=A0A9J6ZER9_9BACL|nr:MAG: hypothetical protein NAG76_22615 [Candidatus Pristimantibacillus lignocellulolyticus]